MIRFSPPFDSTVSAEISWILLEWFLLERAPQGWQRSRTGWWVSSQPYKFLTRGPSVSCPWSKPRPSLTARTSHTQTFSYLTFSLLEGRWFFPRNIFFRNLRPIPVKHWCLLHQHFRADVSTECVFVGLGDRVQHCSFCDWCFLAISWMTPLRTPSSRPPDN